MKQLRTIAALLTIIVVVSLLVISCDDDDEFKSIEDSPWLVKKESRLIAEDFLRNSPTFLFDGIDASIEQAAEGEAAGPDKWRFLFSFVCESPGYGDRSNMELEKEETYHEAYITVEDGDVVVKAVLDNNWDMIDQESTDDWDWGEAGKQAIYGVISVFGMLVLLTLLTRLSGSVIARIESRQTAGTGDQSH